MKFSRSQIIGAMIILILIVSVGVIRVYFVSP